MKEGCRVFEDRLKGQDDRLWSSLQNPEELRRVPFIKAEEHRDCCQSFLKREGRLMFYCIA